MKSKLFSRILKIIVLDYAIVSALAVDTISLNQTLLDGETIVSAGGAFALGFFDPLGSNNARFVGIWSNKHPDGKVFWVANREKPVTGSLGAVMIGSDGNLIIIDGKNSTVWSTNVTLASNNTIVVLQDNGNLVLTENKSNGLVLWESFNYPSDTLLPGMKIGLDQRTGIRIFTSSWKDERDPMIGDFIAILDNQTIPQIVIMNGSARHWRTGQWTGTNFIGIASVKNDYRTGFGLNVDGEEMYFTYSPFNDPDFTQSIILGPTGDILLWDWDNKTNHWFNATIAPIGPCDLYGMCGPNGNCSNVEVPICNCLRGYEPKFNNEWSSDNWSSGCVKRTEFQCEVNGSLGSDEFMMFPGMKLPDFSNYVSAGGISECKSICLQNCSCHACAYVDGIGCMLWGDDMIDLQKFPSGGEELHIRLAFSELDSDTTSSINVTGGKRPSGFLAILVIPGVIVLAIIIYILYKRRIKKQALADKLVEFSLPVDKAHEGDSEVPFFTLQSIEAATDKFSGTNILGQGGFGPVYKGRLSNGQEIAVKRLSKSSGQGNEEFKNEVILFSKLQHRNLVKLLGLCIHGEEKMLVYEYMLNKSLDSFIFRSGSTEREALDWSVRYNIIEGIARGLLYLHRDSRLKIIHRDLKASNILLDEHMNPKISDFGMAKVFCGDQSVGNTNRVVGTYGYMPPEYAMHGRFSEKSDVFSFGVLLLEIVSGKRNNGHHHNDKISQNLLAYAWQLWNEEKPLELLDSNLVSLSNSSQVKRCIHVALLCVQERVNDRPTMSIVVSMLSNDIALAFPERPAFSLDALPDRTNSSSSRTSTISENRITLTTINGR